MKHSVAGVDLVEHEEGGFAWAETPGAGNKGSGLA